MKTRIQIANETLRRWNEEDAKKPPQQHKLTLADLQEMAEKAGRDDLVSPGVLVRDSAGNVIGCRNFAV